MRVKPPVAIEHENIFDDAVTAKLYFPLSRQNSHCFENVANCSEPIRDRREEELDVPEKQSIVGEEEGLGEDKQRGEGGNLFGILKTSLSGV